MRRGDVYLADLNPASGSEANKVRPVVLVARNDALAAVERHGRGVVTIVPLTSKQRVHGRMHVLIEPGPANGLQVTSKAQAEQVRSVDVSRLLRRLGRLGRADLAAVETSLRYHLAL